MAMIFPSCGKHIVGEGKKLPGSCVVLRTRPRIFDEVTELTRSNTVTTMQKPRIKGVLPHIVRVLGIYCNGFWGCGALGPHECNQSDLSHSIKEVELVEGKISTLQGIYA